MTDLSKLYPADDLANYYADVGKRLEISRKWAEKWEKKSSKLLTQAQSVLESGDLKVAEAKLRQLGELNQRQHQSLQNTLLYMSMAGSEDNSKS